MVHRNSRRPRRGSVASLSERVCVATPQNDDNMNSCSVVGAPSGALPCLKRREQAGNERAVPLLRRDELCAVRKGKRLYSIPEAEWLVVRKAPRLVTIMYHPFWCSEQCPTTKSHRVKRTAMRYSITRKSHCKQINHHVFVRTLHNTRPNKGRDPNRST